MTDDDCFESVRIGPDGEPRFFCPPLHPPRFDIEHYARLAQERREREQKERTARQLHSDDARAKTLMRSSRSDERLRGYRFLADVLARRHGIAVEWRAPREMPVGAAAFASVRRRRIVVPPIVDDETLAIFLHEAGHVLCERCGGGLHAPDPRVRDWLCCLQCETLAWARALTLAPFSLEMFRRLQQSLATYRRSTAGPREAVAALDRTRSNTTFAEDRQRRVKFRIAEDLVQQWRRSR